MGSPNEFGRLFKGDVTSIQKATEILSEIPLKHEVLFASFLAPRSEKVRQAQDDIQWFYLGIAIEKGDQSRLFLLLIIQYFLLFLLTKRFENKAIRLIRHFLHQLVGDFAVGFDRVPMDFVHIVAGDDVLVLFS